MAPTTKCSGTGAVTSVVNRYYDPTTDQFLSIDPAVATTGQPYVFVNDSPLNSTDPLGLKLSATQKLSTAMIKLEAAAKKEKKHPTIANKAAELADARTVVRDAGPVIARANEAVNAATETGVTEVPSQVAIAKSNQSSANSCQNFAQNIMVGGTAVGLGLVFFRSAVEVFGAATGAETGGIGFAVAGLAIFATSVAVTIGVESTC